MRTLKIGLSGLNPTQMVEKATNIIDRMTDNPNFVTPNPTLADFELAKDELSAAISAASAGDRNAILHRNVKTESMAKLIRFMAFYVSSVCEGDGEKLSSSGFELKKEPEPMGPVSTPVRFLAQRTQLSGAVRLDWKAVRGARSYVIEMSKQHPDSQAPQWEQVAITTHSKAEFEDLDVGNYYWFRVRSIGKSNKSSWSDFSQVMVA